MAEGNEPDGSKTMPAPDGEGTQPKMYDEKTYKEAVSESISRRKKIDELEAKLKAIEDEKLSDSEKKDKRVKELETELANVQGSIKQKEIDILVSDSIAGKNFVDIPTVKLLVKTELSSEETIDGKVIEKIVDKLIKDKPFLVSSTTVNPSSGNFSKQNGDSLPNANEAMIKFLKS